MKYVSKKLRYNQQLQFFQSVSSVSIDILDYSDVYKLWEKIYLIGRTRLNEICTFIYHIEIKSIITNLPR